MSSNYVPTDLNREIYNNIEKYYTPKEIQDDVNRLTREGRYDEIPKEVRMNPKYKPTVSFQQKRKL